MVGFLECSYKKGGIPLIFFYHTVDNFQVKLFFSFFYKLIRKESLNSDGQQFNQYLQNEQSPLTRTH